LVYARVSTDDQLLDLQQDALTKVGCERIFTDCESGAKADATRLRSAGLGRPVSCKTSGDKATISGATRSGADEGVNRPDVNGWVANLAL